MQGEDRIEAARKIEQLPYGHARFAWIVAPGRDGGCNGLVQVQQAVLGRRECCQAPERLGAAINFVRFCGVLFEERFAMLKRKERPAALARGISRRRANRRGSYSGRCRARGQQSQHRQKDPAFHPPRTLRNQPRDCNARANNDDKALTIIGQLLLVLVLVPRPRSGGPSRTTWGESLYTPVTKVSDRVGQRLSRPL